MPRAVGGLNTFTVVSGISMEPTFHTGDLIISRKADRYKLGDVVTFKIPDEKYKKIRIIHRVIGKNDDGGYKIQGDNQDHADPWSVPAANIVGRKVFLIPRGGFALGYARNPLGLALLFGALVTWTFWPKRHEKTDDGDGREADEEDFLHPDPLNSTNLKSTIPHKSTSHNTKLKTKLKTTLTETTMPIALLESAQLEHAMTSDTTLTEPSVDHPTFRGRSVETCDEAHQGIPDNAVPPQVMRTKVFDRKPVERPFASIEPTERHLADWTNRGHLASQLPPADQVKLPDGTEREVVFGQLGDANTPKFTDSWSSEDDPITPEGTQPQPQPQPTIDELLERWINDEADAPIPEELFASA